MVIQTSRLRTTHQIPNLDYSHLFQVIKAICVNNDDLYEAYRRMCFNVLYKNKDDHGKNFSFIYDDRLKGYKSSPAYDLTKTELNFEHQMSILGIGNPTKKDLLKIAAEFNLSQEKCLKIIDKIEIIIE